MPKAKTGVARAKALSQIEKMQAEADALFLSIGEGALATDEEGRINRVNQAALDILGYERKDLIGKWYPGVIIAEKASGEVLSNINRPIIQAFLRAKPVSRRVFYRKKNGSRVAVAINVAPLLRRGRPIGAIEVFRDITRELALERARDDFISVASHQLRTPATAVKQYVGMLLEGYAGKMTKRQTGMLNRAYDSNERQLNIIEDLLKVARVDAGKIQLQLEDIDLIGLVGEIINEQAAKSAGKRQIISLSAKSKELVVSVDKAKIRMVLENIIDNALKYSKPGKTVAISIIRRADMAVIDIKDEGVGIAIADMNKLFKKFSRVQNDLSIEAGGTGLGLYWAERIIKLHQGQIKIKSSPARGSTFSICIPLQANNPTEKS